MPVLFDDRNISKPGLAPRLSEQAEAVLAEFEFSTDEIQALWDQQILYDITRQQDSVEPEPASIPFERSDCVSEATPC